MPTRESSFPYESEVPNRPVIGNFDITSATHGLLHTEPFAPIAKHLGFASEQTFDGQYCRTAIQYPEGEAFIDKVNSLPHDRTPSGYERPALLPVNDGRYSSVEFFRNLCERNAILFDISGYAGHHDVAVHGLALVVLSADLFRHGHRKAQEAFDAPDCQQGLALSDLMRTFDTSFTTIQLYKTLVGMSGHAQPIRMITGAKGPAELSQHVADTRKRVLALNESITGSKSLLSAEEVRLTWEGIKNEHIHVSN